MVRGNADHVSGDHAQQPTQQKGDQGHHNQVRQLHADELLSVQHPLVEDLAQEAAFGKPARSVGNKKRCIAKLMPLD